MNTCDFGGVTPELMIRSLMSGITAMGNNTCGLRIVEPNTGGKTFKSPQACATASDFWDLFRRTIVLADDGFIAIRAIRTVSASGTGLKNCAGCANAFTLNDLAKFLFVEDNTGLVYLNIISITS